MHWLRREPEQQTSGGCIIAPTAAIPVTLGHYRIIEKLGEGGMGEVYRAHDERLDRDIAIKVLPASAIADDTARKRFRKEALALSKLNHPNVETIFDFDRDNGVDFIVTEYVPGEGLHRKVAQGALSEAQVLRHGLQLAEGMAAAHEQGILHRDLKPANIHITPDNRLKILDFGLAKLTTPDDIDAVTASQSEHTRFAGTLPYMAPEQIKGEALDARTDVWAAGCVLYEMASGRRAFPGAGLQVADEILHLTLDTPSTFNPQISAALDAVILKCLHKDPGSRYGSARELADDLERLQLGVATAALTAIHTSKRRAQIKVAAGLCAFACILILLLAFNIGGIRNRILGRIPHRITSIAVLPLENLSGDPQQDYFADGITESLISNLGTLRVKVMSRSAVERFKKTKKSPAEIADDLGVHALVTGSVLRSSGQVRVTAHLINPKGEQLWTGTYDQPTGNILRLQAQITAAIAAELRVKLTADQQKRLASAQPIDPEAYDNYLMGRYHMYKMERAGFDKAIEYFELALDKDPNYTPAALGIAQIWGLRKHMGFPSVESSAKTKAAVTKLLEADSTSADVHESKGTALAWIQWKWEAGLNEYQRAIEINPSHADAHFFYSLTLFALRRPEQARAQMDAALEVDPDNAAFHQYSAVQLRTSGHGDAALLELDRAEALSGRPVSMDRARTYERMGRSKEAIEAWKKAFATNPEAAQALEAGYRNSDYKNAMRSVANALGKNTAKGADRWSITIAGFYVAAGENDVALDWLEAACDQRLGPLPYINARNGGFESLRKDPRFKQLLRRMNLPN